MAKRRRSFSTEFKRGAGGLVIDHREHSIAESVRTVDVGAGFAEINAY